ncbi:uncharacterized protein LOC132316076 isoform X2 [Cornus florida]|uniref:uncharacterized protein LOC132316076 isoform X2 n=1 Tax=Cornus florida TaxID=4283 RepID=UPI00289C94DD|nr:uncharacterized protein LOC132316076 isoform X2 [Cornus florida]
MVVVQAAKLDLPKSPPSLSLSSPHISSLLYEPHSLSLALMHSDSSFSLYPSFSPFSLPSHSPTLDFPQTFIPSPSSSATFLRLQNPNPNSTPRVLFLVASPHRAGAAVHLRFWILRKSRSFVKAQVVCNQSGLRFDSRKVGVVFDVNHGVSIQLVGSINVFAMYSVSNCKIWVFAVKMAGDEDDDGVTVKLMKCAVIDCCKPVSAISVSFGFLILGEENGVRVFPLRPLVKGRVRKQKNLNSRVNNDRIVGQRSSLPNGVIQKMNDSDDLSSNSVIRSSYRVGGEGIVENSSNGYPEGKIDKHGDRVKPRSMKLRQDCKGGGVCFVAFKSKEVENFQSTKPLNSAKAISIDALSATKFMILDSLGGLHLLCLSSPVLGPEIPCHMNCLTSAMEVQKLAVLPDTSTRTETIWLSNGHHSVHMMTLSDPDTSVNESDKENSEEKPMQFSGSIFAYAIS